MKHLIILLIAIILLSFQTLNTEYEAFIQGDEALAFQYVDNQGTPIHYYFYKVPNEDCFEMAIDSKVDSRFYLYNRANNKECTLRNKWGEFRFYFKKGNLDYIVQEIYANEDYGIENFTITFDL